MNTNYISQKRGGGKNSITHVHQNEQQLGEGRAGLRSKILVLSVQPSLNSQTLKREYQG